MELKGYHYLILGLLLAFAFFSTYSETHLEYPFPYHHDEWQHLGISMQAMEEGYNKVYNPFLGAPGWHADLESGFHLFLANIFLMTGLNPVLSYQYLAAIFAVITGFVIFLCVYRLTGKFYAGILALIVFISLKSNVNILGKSYFVPMTMAMPFIFLFILFFLTSLKEKSHKKFLFSFVLLFLIFLIHPPSAIILGIPVLVEILFNIGFMEKIYEKFRFFFLALPFFALLVFLLLWKGEWQATLGYFSDLLVFEQGWGKIEIAYFLPALYGWAATLFAVYGFVVANKMRLRFFMIFAFVSIGMTAFFNIFGFAVVIPYSRAIHYSMLSLLPLTALGVLSALQLVYRKIENNDALQTLACFVFLLIVVSSSYTLDTQYKTYGQLPLDRQDYNALIWIKETYGSDNVLVTPYFMTSAVYPVSGSKAISLIPSQMGGGLIEENLNFYTYTCDKQEEIAGQANASLVLSKLPIECSFLEQVYSRGDFVYSVRTI